MFIHDLLKIKYSREGYLPDYPYHLISDKEMFDAFLHDENDCYFKDNYPCIDEDLRIKYDILVIDIQYHINQYLSKDINFIPNWVYSYMIGAVIGPNSNQYDIHDLLVSLGLDNVEDEFTIEIYNSIYNISSKYVSKLKYEDKTHRHPTIFGEPHVLKFLRLKNQQ